MNRDEFIKEVSNLGITLDDNKLNLLDQFFHILIRENEKINLTRIVDENEVYLKHFYDSLTLIKSIDLSRNLKVCDVGTGAGFPGIVLKIVFPNLKIDLVDSLDKRVKYLNNTISELGLTNIKAIHSRAEDYCRNHYEEYDLVVSRAVARLSVLSEITIPMLKVNAYFIAMKANLDDEIINSEDILHKLDSKIVDVNNFVLPLELSTRNLVKIEKLKQTNRKYPRTFDKIKKSN